MNGFRDISEKVILEIFWAYFAEFSNKKKDCIILNMKRYSIFIQKNIKNDLKGSKGLSNAVCCLNP